MRIHSWTLALAVAGLTLMGCASGPPLRTVSHVELPRYMGDWYVIANIPYFGEKDCFDSVESYALLEDRSIHNWFECRRKSFEAPMERRIDTHVTVKNKETNAEWRVPFFKVFRVKYLIVDLDPGYQWVAVAHPSRRWGWVMARTKTLPDETYQAILQRLGAQGYDPSQFRKVPQR